MLLLCKLFSLSTGENIFKAIKRLGGDQKGKTSSADRWKKKKLSDATAIANAANGSSENMDSTEGKDPVQVIRCVYASL